MKLETIAASVLAPLALAVLAGTPSSAAFADDGAHPADALPDQGIRLHRLVLIHPEAGALRAALAPLITDARLTVTLGAEPQMAAEFKTPAGLRVLA